MRAEHKNDTEKITVLITITGSPDDMKISALALAGDGQLLVLERAPNAARLYLANPGPATNVLGSRWDDLATRPSIEAADSLAVVGFAYNASVLLPSTSLSDKNKINEVIDKVDMYDVDPGGTSMDQGIQLAMDEVAKQNMIKPESRTNLLGNTLVLVTAKDNPIQITLAPGADLKGALKGGRLAVGDPQSVPAGKYGQAALEKLGLWASVEPQLARAARERGKLVRVQLRFAAGRGELGAGQASSGDEELFASLVDLGDLLALNDALPFLHGKLY